MRHGVRFQAEIFSAVSNAMKSDYVGVADDLRRPHGIKEYKCWKAAEWKNFIIFNSVSAIHYIPPKQAMHGLSTMQTHFQLIRGDNYLRTQSLVLR